MLCMVRNWQMPVRYYHATQQLKNSDIAKMKISEFYDVVEVLSDNAVSVF